MFHESLWFPVEKLMAFQGKRKPFPCLTSQVYWWAVILRSFVVLRDLRIRIHGKASLEVTWNLDPPPLTKGRMRMACILDERTKVKIVGKIRWSQAPLYNNRPLMATCLQQFIISLQDVLSVLHSDGETIVNYIWLGDQHELSCSLVHWPCASLTTESTLLETQTTTALQVVDCRETSLKCFTTRETSQNEFNAC